MCSECGARGLTLPGSTQWFENYAVCEDCQQQRSSRCAVCCKGASPSVTLQSCSTCHRSVPGPCSTTTTTTVIVIALIDLLEAFLTTVVMFFRHVHSECASESTGDKYTCLLCKEAPPPPDQAETRAGEASEEDNAVIKMTTEPSDEPAVTEEHTTTSAKGLTDGTESVEDETPMELGMYA